jgi:GNAT superfamily N-acetyltransferase
MSERPSDPADHAVDRFLDAFGAPGPDPTLAERLRLFGQFVGSWDLEVTWHHDDGTTTVEPGEWHFGWALAGRAVADVWICPRRAADGSSPGEHGLSVRFHDEELDAWRSTWIGPARRIVRPFVARARDGGIVLEGRFADVDARWSFSDITPTTFRWSNEESGDGGRTWRLVQSFAAVRAAVPPD